MKYFISRRLYWLALGVGMLVLAGGISVFAWLLQHNEGLGPVLEAPSSAATGAKSGAGGGQASSLPVRDTTGLPTKNTTAAGSSPVAEAWPSEDAGGAGPELTAADSAGVSDSLELGLQRGGPAPAANGATETGLPELDAAGAGQWLTAANVATVSDSAQLRFQREEPPPPRADPGDGASFQDSVALVVRDAEGNIKQQETVR